MGDEPCMPGEPDAAFRTIACFFSFYKLEHLLFPFSRLNLNPRQIVRRWQRNHLLSCAAAALVGCACLTLGSAARARREAALVAKRKCLYLQVRLCVQRLFSLFTTHRRHCRTNTKAQPFFVDAELRMHSTCNRFCKRRFLLVPRVTELGPLFSEPGTRSTCRL